MRSIYLTLAALMAALVGCSTYAVPHQPYTPLLNRAGQVDIQASGGAATGGAAPTFAVQGAYAPIDHLEIVAGVDFDPVGNTSESETLHAAGELGIGTFVVDDPYMRAELIGGLGVGWGSGLFISPMSFTAMSGTTIFPDYTVSGLYVRPFLQGSLVNVAGVFEWGGGIRLAYTWADLGFAPNDAEYPQHTPGAFQQMHVDPYALTQLRFEYVTIQFLGGLSFSSGDVEVGPTVNAFASLGVHVHFETEPEPEPASPTIHPPPGG